MRISLAQLNPTLGDIEYNISKIDQALAEGQANGAELVVFPEMALTGYPIKGQLTLNWMREAAVEGADGWRPCLRNTTAWGLSVDFLQQHRMVDGTTLLVCFTRANLHLCSTKPY